MREGKRRRRGQALGLGLLSGHLVSASLQSPRWRLQD